MASFLELCADLARESGAINPAPVTVVGQTARQKQCVEWVKTAWVLIQNISPYWSWLRAEFEGTLTINDASYNAAELGIATRFSEWMNDTEPYRAFSIYDNSIGRADEGKIRQISYNAWKNSYDTGTHDAGRPQVWAEAPDGSIRFGPKPDKAYKVRGEYRKTPQVLAADTDQPEMPSRFHSAIWQRAIILMAASDEAVTALQTAQLEFGQNLTNMQRDCLPKFNVRAGGPMDR